MAADDVLLIDSRVHRAQGKNREAARERLVDLVERAMVRPKTRTATKPKRAAKERRIEAKKIRSTVKATRRRASKDE